MNRSLQNLSSFSKYLSVCDKSTFFDDKIIQFLRPKNLLFTRNALEIFMFGTDE